MAAFISPCTSPGADTPGEDVAPARMNLAPFDMSGRQFRKAKPPTPAQAEQRKAILSELTEAERNHRDNDVERLKREFLATYTFEDDATAAAAT